MIGRIRKVIGLEAKSMAAIVFAPAFAGEGSVQEAGRGKMHSRVCGKHFQDPAGRGLDHTRAQTKAAGRLVDYPIMIVSAGELKLFIIVIDSSADSRRLAKIKARSRDIAELAGGNQKFVGG